MVILFIHFLNSHPFETHRLVLPSDLNQFGFLFGGKLLAWVDETAWIAASIMFPHCQFVTVGMDRVEFRKGVSDGAILKICAQLKHKGNTSVSFEVSIFDIKISANEPIFSTVTTFVSVNDQGLKKLI